ncbi:Hypothetical protein CINCED_3A022368 [Cinara cedri]|uniref:Uncharacterized protein n=1 Tax=Cinara cedri TaxID=506608 RepID=A0A5E4N2P2_9HEMI|nr:Hypothetical protein CINCED_3A022368 [Cinara cedri]
MQVSIFGAKVTYFKKPDYFKLKTFEENNLSKDKDQEFNVTFGTKRSSRMSKAKSKEAVTATETIFDNISSFESLDNSYSPSTEFLLYLPLGCNRFTNKLENAYPISTLLHEEEISSMKNYAQEVLSMIPVSVDNEDLSQFYIASINRLSHKSIQNICLLMFADGLIELLKLRSADLNYVRNLDIYPNCVIINDKVLDNFIEYTSTGPDLTSKMKDKALCHIIIIMILSNMNVLDLSWITPFISMNCQKRLIVLMRIVGASPLKEDKYKYTLKIPLASLPQLNKKLKHSKRPR